MDKRSVALVLALAACSSPSPPPEPDAGPIGGCKLAYLGDPSAEPIMEVIALGPGGELQPISDGSSISLIFPPQGGRVVFAGVRATNVDPCAVRVAGALRDPVTKQVRLDTRIINLEPTDDGHGRSAPTDISTFSNIAACPNQWAEEDLFDKPYELTVSLTDRDGKKVTKIMTVTPRCDEPGYEAECLCMCAGDYVLGMQCDPDAGPIDPDLDAGADGNPPDASGGPP
ncbi:hypothetical protein KEG38_11635 [Polyangium jinanense]|uniref:hypothetical protein n=1 Tax=Polyangium jinanense TaxID=2829994 RepID=UPI0023405457|nr:hypothetical protein [Polyangium jinanense]MDC3954505.1 hypothetical protein [Polyangium jinanense]